MLPYSTVIAGSSTNVRTPTTGELNQGNDQLTVYDSAKNNGYYRQMSAQIYSISAELINVINAGGVTPSSSNDNLITALRTFFTPIGSTIDHAANTPPTGFLECDGSAISRTTYAALFAVIGTTWGSGNGSTTFNIPDFRGYFKRGWAHGGSVDSGRSFASTQQDAFQGHFHAQPNGSQAWGAVGSLDAGNVNGSQVSLANTGSPVNDGTNGVPRTASETRPVNKALLICIKY